MLYHGDVAQAAAYADEITQFTGSPLRDWVLGFLAMLSHRPLAAERLLQNAWDQCDPVRDPTLAATIARRNALHFLYRLRGDETVAWSERATVLADEGQSRVPSEMLPLGVGIAYAGRLGEGLAAVERALEGAESSLGRGSVSLRRARGWLRHVNDDLRGAQMDLGEEVDRALSVGSWEPQRSPSRIWRWSNFTRGMGRRPCALLTRRRDHCRA